MFGRKRRQTALRNKEGKRAEGSRSRSQIKTGVIVTLIGGRVLSTGATLVSSTHHAPLMRAPLQVPTGSSFHTNRSLQAHTSLIRTRHILCPYFFVDAPFGHRRGGVRQFSAGTTPRLRFIGCSSSHVVVVSFTVLPTPRLSEVSRCGSECSLQASSSNICCRGGATDFDQRLIGARTPKRTVKRHA